jgi:hypothetical protein
MGGSHHREQEGRMTVFTIETSRRDLIAALADAVAGGAVPFVILALLGF